MLNKTIWTYWDNGKLPYLVAQCVNSWRRLNPGWKVHLLSREEALTLVDLNEFADRADISVQFFSDLLRLKLLQKFGGVWVDATLFCAQPLDQWLPKYFHNNFFAFSCDRPDRLMTIWFLAAQPSNPLFDLWADSVYRFWQSHRFRASSYVGRQILHKLMSLRKRNFIGNEFWFHSVMLNKLRLHPYPINMYLFEHTLNQHPEFKSEWFNREVLYDKPAEALQMKYKINAPISEASKLFIKESTTPVHKLNWRQDLGYAKAVSNFEYLLEHFLTNSQKKETYKTEELSLQYSPSA